ncbi:flagellar hook protein FlgE [Candidatus Liberibacter sp.]|uniref:flagellar hook protein FlgE n=1 Tax=Candidatus Liberibacter sp. TaxID=34022 RepID=UPI0015F458D1|nr:flagellar hook protein FlgE [Candidatus Liberibacter sp.]MBA5723549.1 flagellar hook protein FlgE [Candidatus Liberibacter sp.]
MGILGTMKTAMSGMDAQSSRVSVVSDNLANINTTGYKRAAVSFSSFVFPSTRGGAYTSGGLEASTKNMVSEQGSLIHTTSNTDLAIQGDGFFVVKDNADVPYLTRSGSFKIDNEGYLQNTAGYALLGYPLKNSAHPLTLNSFAGLEKINLKDFELKAVPTTKGSIPANLDKDAESISIDSTPNKNKSASHVDYTNKSSFSAYDNLGSEVIYDLYYTKVGGGKWEISIFRQDQATQNGFPYMAVDTKTKVSPLATSTFSFDLATGSLADDSPKEVSFIDSASGVDQNIKIDVSKMTQLAGGFIPQKTDINGQAPGIVKDIIVSKDGIVEIVSGYGIRTPVYRLGIATVPSVDNLKTCTGNVYLPTRKSGSMSIGFPGNGQRGAIFAGALETSNVDIADELAEIIEAQRNYAANSKVFQTGSEFMDILINLKR